MLNYWNVLLKKCVHLVIDRRTLRKKCEFARSSDMTLKSNFLSCCSFARLRALPAELPLAQDFSDAEIWFL